MKLGNRTLFTLQASTLAALTVSTNEAGSGISLDAWTFAKFGILTLNWMIGLAFLVIDRDFRRVSRSLATSYRGYLAYCLIGMIFVFRSSYFDFSVSRLAVFLFISGPVMFLAAHYLRSVASPFVVFVRHLYILAIGFSVVALPVILLSGFDRVSPTLGLSHPVPFSGLFGVIIALALAQKYWLPSQMDAKMDIYRLLVIGVAMIPFLVMFTRGTFVALIAVVGLIFLRPAMGGRPEEIFARLMVSFALPATAWLASEPILSLISRGQSRAELSSLTGRTDVWTGAIDGLAGLDWFFGHGFAVVFPKFAFQLNYGFLYSAHNSFLEALATNGLIGLAAISWFLFGSFAKANRNTLNRFEGAFGAQVAIVFLIVSGLSDSTFGSYLTPAFAVMLSIVGIHLGQAEMARRAVPAQVSRSGQDSAILRANRSPAR